VETPLPRSRRQLPEKIGRYRVVGRLGKGAMGVVFSAYDDVMARSVAIKMMMADVQDDPEASARFFREAHAAGQLVHRNIITIFDLGDEDGRPYIVMELLEGQMLGDYLRRPDGVQLEDKISLMLQVCDGLRLAHAKGIFHRDIKPGNLHVTPAGDLKILDFGIARLATSSMTMSGLIVGTPDYMSPEQACGREVDQRSDIFSAGAVFYLMITGRKPFAAPDLPAVLMKVQNEDPLPIRETEAPPALAAAIMKAMAKDPAARYQSTPELIADLNRVSRDLALDTGRIGEQARIQFEAAEKLAVERASLVRDLGSLIDVGGTETAGEIARQGYPAVSAWLDGRQADPLYRTTAQDVLRDVTAIHQALLDETTGFRQAGSDLQAGAAAVSAGEWIRAVRHFDAVSVAVPGCTYARQEADRLRRLIAEKQAADDRRRALLGEADAAVDRADWSAVIALADEVLASDSTNDTARALREKAAAALAAETRRRRQQLERALGRAEQLARNGRYAEAEEVLDEARRADPDAPLIAEAAERIRVARLEAERISERERRAAEAIAAARTRFGQGQRQEAISDLRAYLAQEPDLPGVAGAVRELCDEADRLVAAERRRAQAAEHANAAHAALERDDPDTALAEAREALGLFADDELARRIQGLATARLRERKAAAERAEQAELLLQRARGLLDRRKYASAREQAKAAGDLIPSNPQVQALLADIDRQEAGAQEEERQEREARQRTKAAAPVLAMAKSAEASRDYARAGWLAENALALDPHCDEARAIIQRTQATLSAEPESEDDTVKVTGAASRPPDTEDTVTLIPSLPVWRRLADVIRSWVHIGDREGA
jgi:eukaryotic-like serine/threonine-protein kinase